MGSGGAGACCVGHHTSRQSILSPDEDIIHVIHLMSQMNQQNKNGGRPGNIFGVDVR